MYRRGAFKTTVVAIAAFVVSYEWFEFIGSGKASPEAVPVPVVLQPDGGDGTGGGALNDPRWAAHHGMSFVYIWARDARGAAAMHGLDQLRYALRSIAMFAPWHTGTVYVVVADRGDDAAPPKWLAREHPRVRVVYERTLLPDGVPRVVQSGRAVTTVPSGIIEQYLHRLEGVSDVFVNIPPGTVFARPVHVSDFVTPDGGVKLYYGGVIREADLATSETMPKTKAGEPVDRQRLPRVHRLRLTTTIVRDVTNAEEGAAAASKLTLRYIPHGPVVMHKAGCAAAHEYFAADIAQKTVLGQWPVFPYLHHHALTRRGGGAAVAGAGARVILDSATLGFVNVHTIVKGNTQEKDTRLPGVDAFAHLSNQVLYPHTFFTVMLDDPTPQAVVVVRGFLHAQVPAPSPFEAGAAGGGNETAEKRADPAICRAAAGAPQASLRDYLRRTVPGMPRAALARLNPPGTIRWQHDFALLQAAARAMVNEVREGRVNPTVEPSGGGWYDDSSSTAAAETDAAAPLTYDELLDASVVAQDAFRRCVSHHWARGEYVQVSLDTEPVYTYIAPRRRSKRPLDDPFWKQYHNMSLVYSWVNGTDELFLSQKLEHQGRMGRDSTKDLRPGSHRATEELMHSFRLLELFLPWHTGMIYIVTPNGMRPAWLDPAHTRVKVIDQYDIMPKRFFPTFNSAHIERFLHRIEGLTDIFVQINDDYMFGRPVHPSDFITDDGGVRLYHEQHHVGRFTEDALAKAKKGGRMWYASVMSTMKKLDEAFGNTDPATGIPRQRRFLKHAPFVYHKGVMEWLNEHMASDLDAAVDDNRQRTWSDLLIPFLHNNAVIESPELQRLGYKYTNHAGYADLDAMFIGIRDGEMNMLMLEFNKMLHYPHQMVALNDAFKRPETRELLRAFLHRLAPFPSSFEHRGHPYTPESWGGIDCAGDVPASVEAFAARGLRVPLRSDVVRWSSDPRVMRRRVRRFRSTPGQAETHASATPEDVMLLQEHWARQCAARRWRRGDYT